MEGLSVELFVADNDPLEQQAVAVCAGLADDFRWPLSATVVPEPGVSAVRNAILDRARQTGADFIAMLDDDEVADPNWLRELIDAQQRTGADIVGAPVLYDFEREPGPALLRSGYFTPRRWAAGPVPLLDQTGNVLLSCLTLEALGWPRFDRSFGLTGGEDKEYFTRLKKRGVRFAWAPGAIARETVPGERLAPEWVLRRAFRTGNADMRIARLHGSRREVLISLGKALAVLAAAPLTSLLLLAPSQRIRTAAKWARARGKLAALRGHRFEEYARGD